MQRLVLISILISLLFSGCSGCSESGIRHQSAQNVDNKPYRNSERIAAPSPADLNISKDNEQSLLKENEEASLSDLYSSSKSAVFTVYTSDDEMVYQGSGFFISSDGLAVSNYHIFEGTLKGNEIILTESGNEHKISRVIEQDKNLDYIIFKVSGSLSFNSLSITKHRPEIGEEVFAIGNPKGLSHTLSTGIISSYRDNGRLLQTTTEITNGSSGGALLNMNGEVVGITTGGIGEANLNFALNIKELKLERFF